IHTAGETRTIYVNPDLPDWLPDLTLKNLRAGKGAAELRLKRDQVEVVTNTTGFEIVHGRILRPPLKETPLARTYSLSTPARSLARVFPSPACGGGSGWG